MVDDVAKEGGGESALVKTLDYQKSFLLDPNSTEDESGTREEQAAFIKELDTFHKHRFLEFKPPRFYGEPLNCLKLWRSVIRNGGYEQVTAGKVWRYIGESFNPPKTCTTVSWTFRCFYEKALLEYEKYKLSIGDLPFNVSSAAAEPASNAKQANVIRTPGTGRVRRDAAARAMQGWHSQRLLSNGEVGDPIIKDKTSNMTASREKQSIGLLKRKKPSPVERGAKFGHVKTSKPQLDSAIVDVGLPADWVKINVHKTKDCFEVYALVPGLLREEVRVQSDPAGRLVISGEPEQLDNPWGVSPFKKVVSLPSRIDPQQTSAVVTLQGQLFVRVPFEQPSL
ncbi:AT-rich interactive domain-containing protein 5-like [Bidens hawaiensis]|uniref:AT-rich interactive domain-containing protein 5-like n=1 Tax=Bidens hawaiensis TaxID=980011 RepID=UPI00404900CF